MASGGERVQKLTAEAFSRLRSDHEQFLEAYEKPTQIYRFLHARHSFKSLFMHRNLSYMQHLKRKRRKTRANARNRLRTNELLKYRKHRQLEGKDLASQIKSDNFLKITFHGLEKGRDFNKLFSAAQAGERSSESTMVETPSLMEVEVFLYNCHQHLSETVSYPCSGISLGKFELEYSPTVKNGLVSNSVSNTTLTIPESQLVWRTKKNRSTGSLMLVFQARPSTSSASTQQTLGNNKLTQSIGVQSSHQPQLTKVSVEVNRINHTELAHLARTQHPTSSESELSVQGMAGGTDGSKQTRGSPACSEVHRAISSGGAASKRKKAQRKTRSSLVKEKCDASVMTDLCLGKDFSTDSLSPASEVTKKAHSLHPNKLKPTKTPTGPSISTLPTSHQKVGFASTTTPGKVIPMNNVQRNGFKRLSQVNGFPTVDEHLNGCGNNFMPGHNGSSSMPPNSSAGGVSTGIHYPEKTVSDYSLTVSIPCSTAYHNGTAGINSSPSSSTSSTTSSSFSSDTLHNNEGTQHQLHHQLQSLSQLETKQRYKLPSRKRSEIQLLLDGDKPPEERISAEDVPIFTVETLADRTTSPQQPPNVSCTQLGTGTRNKIILAESPSHPSIDSVKLPGRSKRSLSESDQGTNSLPPPPPAKVARISSHVIAQVVPGQTQVPRLDSKDEQRKVIDRESPSTGFLSKPLCANDVDNDRSTSSRSETRAPEGLFCAEVVVFDSRDMCLLENGEYSVLMQKCREKEEDGESEGPLPLVTFSPLRWNTVFGGASEQETEKSENITLKFSLSWSHGPPKNRISSELETALDLQKIRNDYFPPNTTREPSLPSTTASTTVTTAPPSVSGLIRTHNNSSDNGPPPQPGPNHLTSDRDPEKMDTGTPAEDKTVKRTPEKEDECQMCGNGSKEDTEEYFTATEASASPSVADSNELIPCHQSSTTALLHHRGGGGAGGVVGGGGGGREGGRMGGRILYNFIYNNSFLQQTEANGDMKCPWCSLSCHNLYSLLKHMSLCHPRFLFTYNPVQGGSVIDIHVNKSYEAGEISVIDQDPVERSGMSLRQRWKGPLKCLPCTAVLVDRHEGVEEDLSEFLNDGSWKRGCNIKRQYYHSGTCLPMVPEEIEEDSEAERESVSKWEKICSQKMIDDFTDVNRGEKEIMKLWNLFAMENRMIADKQIPTACVQFAREKRREIQGSCHHRGFLAHLVSMCQFGLISPADIKKCMDTVRSQSPSS